MKMKITNVEIEETIKTEKNERSPGPGGINESFSNMEKVKL